MDRVHSHMHDTRCYLQLKCQKNSSPKIFGYNTNRKWSRCPLHAPKPRPLRPSSWKHSNYYNLIVRSNPEVYWRQLCHWYYHIHWKGAALINIFASQFGLLSLIYSMKTCLKTIVRQECKLNLNKNWPDFEAKVLIASACWQKFGLKNILTI